LVYLESVLAYQKDVPYMVVEDLIRLACIY